MNCVAVQKNDVQFEEVFDHLFCGLLEVECASDGDTARVVACNAAFCQLSGFDRSHLFDQPVTVFAGSGIDTIVLSVLDGTRPSVSEHAGTTQCYRPDRTPYLIEWRLVPSRSRVDAGDCWVLIVQDVTARVTAEQERQRLEAVINTAPISVLMTDDQAQVVMANRAFEHGSGLGASELVGTSCHHLKEHGGVSPFVDPVLTALEQDQDLHATFIHHRRDGRTTYLEQHVAMVSPDGEGRHLVSFGQDVTDLVVRQHQLHEAANRDPLTSLPNRRAGELQLRQGCQGRRARDEPLAVILCDVDHFKAINDQHGHPVGDRVLVRLAQSLRDTIRAHDAVIRWGGEEFLILLPGQHLEQAQQLASRVCERITAQPDPEVGSLTVSLGIAVCGPGETPDSLIERADRALYTAKHKGRNRIELADPFSPHATD